METRIEKTVDGNYWNLYVNGNIAVSYESLAVCESINLALLSPDRPRGYAYSEAAEIADGIRNHFASEAK